MTKLGCDTKTRAMHEDETSKIHVSSLIIQKFLCQFLRSQSFIIGATVNEFALKSTNTATKNRLKLAALP